MRPYCTVVFLAVVLASLVRCSTFGAEDTGAPNEVGLPEGAVADARLPETSEGGRDAGVARFCADGGHEFCDDFDEDGRQAVGTRWSTVDGGEQLAVDESFVRSPPRSLGLTTAVLASGGSSSAALTLDVPNTSTFPKTIHVSFDMRVSLLAATSGYLVPVRLRFDGAATAAGFTVSGTATRFYELSPFDGGGQVVSMSGTGPLLVPSVWQHVDLTIDRDARSVTLRFDGSGATHLLAPATTLSGPVHLDLGAPVVTGQATQWKINFDNVTLDVVR